MISPTGSSIGLLNVFALTGIHFTETRHLSPSWEPICCAKPHLHIPPGPEKKFANCKIQHTVEFVRCDSCIHVTELWSDEFHSLMSVVSRVKCDQQLKLMEINLGHYSSPCKNAKANKWMKSSQWFNYILPCKLPAHQQGRVLQREGGAESGPRADQ